jgi:transposase
VEQARVAWAAREGERVEAIAACFRVTVATLHLWRHLNHEHVVMGLEDRPRSGQWPSYSREQMSAIIATAPTATQQLDQALASWVLDRLLWHLQEQHGISMRHRRHSKVLLSEGLRRGPRSLRTAACTTTVLST